MIADRIRKRIEAATVRLPRFGGQGVIVPGQLVITAAHCVQWDTSGAMALGDEQLEQVEAGGHTLLAVIYAVEPVADVAVLGPADNQVLPEEADAFEALCGSVDPVCLSQRSFPLFTPFPIFLLSHIGRWITAEAQQVREHGPLLSFSKASEAITGGDSGGPIVTADGLLVGVVSLSGGGVGEPDVTGHNPHLHHETVPRLLRRMRRTSTTR
jgi:hypothetical protein